MTDELVRIRVKDLTSVQSPASDTVVLTDSAADGVHKRALSDIEQKAASIATSAVSAITARAEAAAAQATDAKNAANAAAASAGTAAEDAQEATEAALEAIEAMGDISELAVPTMSPAIRGGAKLGDGLSLSSDTLNLGPLTKSAQGASVETDGCALFGITGEGWAEQDTTTGKNLLEPNVSYAIYTDDGIIFNCSSEDTTPFSSITLPAGTYTVKATLLTKPTVDRTLRIYKTSTSGEKVLNFDGLSSRAVGFSVQNTFTLSESTVLISKLWGNATNDFKAEVQLEPGDQPTAYEPWTGGQPSPRPDWAQPIRVCRGRNLVDPANVTVLNAYVYNGEIISNSDNRTLVLPVEPLTAYTLIGRHVKISSTVDDWNLAEFTSEPSIGSVGTKINWSVIESDDINFTFVTKATTRYIAVKFANTTKTDADATLAALQLAKGSQPMPYCPYGHVGIEVQGRNLFDPSAITIDKYLDTSGNYVTSGIHSTSDYIPVKGGEKYTLSGLATTSATTRMCWFDSNKSLISPTLSKENGTYTAPANAAYFRFSMYDDDTAGGVIQFEHGASATAYEPYHHSTTPVPLPSKGWTGAAGDYADALSIDSAGKWEWANEVDETVFDGTDGKVSSADNGGAYLVTNKGAKSPSATNVAQAGYCSTMGCVSASNIWNSVVEYGIAVANSGGNLGAIVMHITGVTTVADANTWLASHVTTALYPLFAPTTETGYIDMPDLPSGAVVSCPELESIGVSWFVEGAQAAVEHGNNVLRRAQAENEEIENAIADLATRVAALES